MLKLVIIVAHTQVHDHFFKGGVAGALANAAQRNLCLAHAHAEGGKRVGHGKAEVVVAVHAEDGLVAVGRVLDDVVKQRGVFLRLGHSHGIGQIDGAGPGLDGGLDHAAGKIAFGA